MIIRTAVILLCACSITLSQNVKQPQTGPQPSNRPANTPRGKWEVAREAFMASRFPYLYGFKGDTSRLTAHWDTVQASSSTATVHHLSFSSSANTIELLVSGNGAHETQVLTVQPQHVPDWLSVTPLQQKLVVGKATVARFTIRVKHSAPVNKETSVRFLIQSAGQQWQKDVAILVEPPKTFEVFQSYPNPFNPSTTISYQLPIDGKVSLKVYNTLGQLVTTIVDGQQTAGYHQEIFNGSSLASGVYVYRLTGPGVDGKQQVQQHKMLLVK
jgi:hypothetical protein